MSTYLTDEKEIYDLLTQSQEESKIWRKDYPEFERLADNELIDDLDEDLPEVNDGTLAASLFKLPKRIVNSDLKGRAEATDSDDTWVTELANMQWEDVIIPNANSQAPFHRKWKDAVRKAAIYGSVPLITLFVERGEYIGSDFIVAQPQDVKLEPGKVSDYDSDVMFWDVYYTRLQVKKMIERAKQENEDAKKNPDDGYNKWDIPALQAALDAKEEDSRDPQEDNNQVQNEGVRRKGIKFCVVVQRGVDAPFYMFHPNTKKTVREWSNPDPTGDVPIHFLYCYQDFVNPYGVGIVKLAGGTQNVLDYMRQADVLATQLGFRPPISIGGDATSADLESIVYAQDAQWITGDAIVKREEITTGVYQQLPERINMYKTSLNNLLPMGDTSISAGSGDPLQSKTPAGVKLAAANLSIDDSDFKDNLYMTYEAKAKSMINTHFANMQGTDIMKLSDEQREILKKSGLEFPEDEMGNPTNELEVIWDEARASFKYTMDAEQDKAQDDEKRLEGLLKVAELRKADVNFDADLLKSGKRINVGELYADIVSLTSDNDKILEDVTPEDAKAAEEEQAATQGQAGATDAAGQPQPPKMSVNYKDAPEDIKRQMEAMDGLQPSQMMSPVQQQTDLKQQQLDAQSQKMQADQETAAVEAATAAQQPTGDDKTSNSKTPDTEDAADQASETDAANPEEDEANVQAIMDHYHISEDYALAMVEAEKQGYEPDEILAALERRLTQEQGAGDEQEQ